MEAGHGAEEQMARHARRAERLQRELDAARESEAAVAAALENARRQERAWAAGAEGERQVAGSLDVLRRYGWTFLHDVRWPGRQQANIDHIAIGPGGVVVIDAKNWTGTVTATGGTLRQNGYGRARELEGVAAATAAVTALLDPLHRTATIGMLCLAGQEQEATATTSGVPVVGRHQLAEALLQLPPRLTPYEVADVGRSLARELGDDRPAPARRATRTRRVSMPSGPVIHPSPDPIGSPRSARPASVGRGPRRRPATRRGSGVGGTFVRLGLVLLAVWLFVTNAEPLGAAFARLLLPDSLTSQPAVPVPPGAPTLPEPALPDPALPDPALPDPALPDPGAPPVDPPVDPSAAAPPPEPVPAA